MGTSASSKGPSSNIPLDPPWLDDPQQEYPNENHDPNSQTPPVLLPALAPARRFAGARQNLGEYVRTGNYESLRRAIGHYSKTGMGGSGRVTSRMKTTTRSAANLFRFLQAVREQSDETIREWVDLLRNQHITAYDLANRIVQKVLPSDGSLDESSCRVSMDKALFDLIAQNPEVDFYHLTDDDIWTVIGSFLNYEAYNRLSLDIGKVFESSSLSPISMVNRLNQMRDYLHSEISAQIDKERSKSDTVNSEHIDTIIVNALRNTFSVYEEVV